MTAKSSVAPTGKSLEDLLTEKTPVGLSALPTPSARLRAHSFDNIPTPKWPVRPNLVLQRVCHSAVTITAR